MPCRHIGHDGEGISAGAPRRVIDHAETMIPRRGVPGTGEGGKRRSLSPTDHRRIVPALSLRENFARTLLPYLKEEKPDAVLFPDDEAALGAMQFLHSVGLKIPRDLSIIGFDDDPQGRNATPSLTTIAPDIPLLAEKLTELLLEQLEHKNPPRRLIFPSRLILRESCC